MKINRTARRENQDRWLVSYADFITLLFAFFVVMFAAAQKDRTKVKLVSDSVREAMQHRQLASAITGIFTHTKMPVDSTGDSEAKPVDPPPATPADNSVHGNQPDLEKSLATLNQLLEPEMKAGKVTAALDRRGLVIGLREMAFYGSGNDAVSPAGLPTLAKIAQVIAPLPNPVRIEGHTDAVPIHNSRFRNNWELSTARAIAMLELLNQRFDMASGRMSVAGFAENAPTDTNDTAEGRAHNRRVDLVVLSAEAVHGEPPATPMKASPFRGKSGTSDD